MTGARAGRRALRAAPRGAALARLAAAAVVLAWCAACAGSFAPWHRGEAERPEGLAARAEGPPRRPERVLWVSVAGLPAAGLPAPGLLSELAAHGVVADRVEGVVPPASYPAHASLVTGRAPAAHGIVSDRLLGPRGTRRERAWHVSHLRVQTLWQLAQERGLAVAAFDWPTTLGAEGIDVVPDVLPARRGERWAQLLEGAASPWLVERARLAAPEVGRPGPARDAWLVDAACALLAERPPAFALLRLSQAELLLARHGPDSPEAAEALRGAEGELGRLLACADGAGLLDGLTLVVTGDRSLRPVHTEVRPNVALRDARMVRVVEGAVDSWIAWTRSDGASAFVYARDAEVAVIARNVLEVAARETGAFRVLSADETIRLGGDPEAWFGLETRDGWRFDDGADGALLASSSRRGADPPLSRPDEAGGAFLLWGAGVASGLRVPLVAQTDVAPTLAELLGTGLPESEGRPLLGVLRLPPRPESP